MITGARRLSVTRLMRRWSFRILRGIVRYYFDRIRVAAVELLDDLAVGDWIAFARSGELLFEQAVTSMQIEHQSVTAARPGDNVGLQADQEVKPGVEVYKRVA